MTMENCDVFVDCVKIKEASEYFEKIWEDKTLEKQYQLLEKIGEEFYVITSDSNNPNVLTLSDVPYQVEEVEYDRDGNNSHELSVIFELECGFGTFIDVELPEDVRQEIAEQYLWERGVLK